MTDILENINAIIFDMDGTLIDSMWIWPSIDEEFYKKHSLTPPEDFGLKLEGKSCHEVAVLFKETFPMLQSSVEDIVDEWETMTIDNYKRNAPLKGGAYEFIRQMKSEGKKIGIATSNTRNLVDATLEALGVTELFDCIRTSGEVDFGKPKPDIYLSVASEMQVAPENCLVFEDIPMGILAGKNAGMRVCAIYDDFSKPQEAKKRELADYYIRDFSDIINESYEILS
ncbi:MAG: HAD family phosphatase [Lachnospiraceae bacterium]|jgi:HAD superfamily hydrolase (TIGR01509 family)|nr:HAD family phosphatase [Lachnospiraceae bacterium]